MTLATRQSSAEMERARQALKDALVDSMAVKQTLDECATSVMNHLSACGWAIVRMAG